MDETSRTTAADETRRRTEGGWSGPDLLHDHLRQVVGQLIEQLVEAELDEALGGRRYVRCAAGERQGYRHAARERTVTTSSGATALTVPRGRLFDAHGAATQEWHSQLLPRYHRRSRAVDETVLGAYLAGTNPRRMQRALQPLLKGAPLSKSAVSRVMRTLRQR